ncbi:hypothetical protein B5K03_21545 [Rhizobium phaseoli]|nr:hypothetical protein B5K03_21545 [Rhizobium phaseoli]
MSVLREKAPESCRHWLDHVERWGLWSRLLHCHVSDGSEDDTNIKLLRSTLAWLQDPISASDVRSLAGADAALKPGTGDDEPDADDDPRKNKP